MKRKISLEQKIEVRLMEMLEKIATGKALIIPVFDGKDYIFDKVDVVKSMMKIAKIRKNKMEGTLTLKKMSELYKKSLQYEKSNK